MYADVAGELMQHTGLAYYLSQNLHLPPEVEEGNIEYKVI